MVFTSVKDSGRAMLMEYTPPTPPLTPKKNQLLRPTISWQSPLIESTKNYLEEKQIKNEDFSTKSMQSKCKETPSADSIVPKKFAAAPPTILVPPIHLLSSEDSETIGMANEEESMRTFKLQDPPKGRVKSVTRKFSNCDETDSVFRPSEPASPSRAKCQTSITQYMFPTTLPSPKTKVLSSPRSSSKIVQSPCTPSKRARSSGSTDDENLFVFPSVPRGTTVRVPTSLTSSSPNWNKYRKRSIEDTEVTDDFLELNMSSPTPIPSDPMLYGRGRNSDEAIDVSPRLEKNLDFRNMTHFHEYSQMEKDVSVSSRYERLSCDEISPHKNCYVHKSYNSSPVCHQEVSSGRGFRYYESVSVEQDPNLVAYPTTPLKREEVDGESYFEAVACTMMNKPKNGSNIIHDKICQEPRQQDIHYKLYPFKHSVSELIPSEFIHKPECALPDSFPFVSTFKSAYDEQGVYRRDESCCAWSATEDENPGKILCRRVSNKESIREREYLHDERYWIYKKNCTKDCAVAGNHPMPSHSEESPTSSVRIPNPCNMHPDSQIFPQSSRVAPQYSSASATHVPRSPVPMKITSPTLQSRFSFSPSSKLQQFHLPKSPVSENFLDSSRNSSVYLEHYATESSSLHRRKSPLQSPSGSNMKTFIFPSKHCPRSHASTSNTPWTTTSVNPSFHSRYQYRTSPSSPKWQDEDQHGLPSGLARRRLFCKSDVSQDSTVSTKEDEANKMLRCCHCADQSHLMSYSSADSMLTMERTVNRFLPGHCDEAREPCKCYERARSSQSYQKCPCLPNQRSGIYARRENLEEDNAYKVNKVSCDELGRAVNNLMKRAELVIEEEGGIIEHLL